MNPAHEKKLQDRESNGLLRKMVTSEGLVDFSSNDYLGLARSAELFEQISASLENLGIKKNGAGGSRLLTGNTTYNEAVETRLARIFNADSTLIFNSGYSANVGVVSSLPTRNDAILHDELAHASIIDGARLSLARRFHFKHNDLKDLESKIQQAASASGHTFIAVESIYSMDGDECPLTELTTLAEKYNATIILDEAHSTGVYGAQGSGLAVALGIERKIPIRIYTFGKAMGVHGACVATSHRLQQYLINFARPFIYTTALPVHSLVAIDCAFQHLEENIHLQRELYKKINTFDQCTIDLLGRAPHSSAIKTLITPGNENARRAAIGLQRDGIDVRAILSPTVPEGSERLRICLHVFNTDREIHDLAGKMKILVSNKNNSINPNL